MGHQSRSSAFILIGLATLAPAWAEPEAPATPPDRQAQTVRAEAEDLVNKAGDRVDAFIDWLSTKGADARDGSRRASTWTREWFTRQIETALAKDPPPMGLRVLNRRATGETAPLAWTALDGLPTELPAHVVLLVHGLDETGTVWDDLAPMIQAQGRVVVRFDYANDQPIAQSADDLAAALKTLRARGATTVDIVAHSMGGLVSRDVLTRPAYYAGDSTARGEWPDVRRLIMTATPNQGAPLARVRFLGEAREHVMRYVEGDLTDPRTLLGFLKDGSGEAGDDLLPGSAFLTELNARALPKPVKITIIAGTMGGGVQAGVSELLHSSLARTVLSADEISQLADAAKQLSDVTGDGVVPLDRTKLAGVDDFVHVDANHRWMLNRPNLEHKAREAVGMDRSIGQAVGPILERLFDEK